MERNVHPLVSLLSDGFELLSVIICCCLFHRLNIFYFHNRLKEPRNVFAIHISFIFV